jgi:CBS domain-containing membrane protein
MYSVADLMTRDVITIDVGESLDAVRALRARHPHRTVPVVEQNRLVGLVSVVGEPPAAGGVLTVRDAMTAPVPCVRPGTPLRHAAEMMLSRQLACLPVVDEAGRLAGMLTEADLVRFALEIVTELDRMSDGLRRDSRQEDLSS